MARPKKKGLDYFPLDIDFFSDTKIKLLKARFGADGITIYVYLLCEIYKNGYYVKADEDFQYVMSDDLSMSIDKVKQVLKFLLERSLLDSKLFQSDTILTSAGIQRRFQIAVKERAKKNPVEITRFWLLSESETEPFIKVTHFDEKSKKSIDFSKKNNDFSLELSLKKSKVNNNNIYFENPELENAFKLYIGMRMSGKGGITKEQISILKEELIEIGKDDQERIAIVKKAFASGWKSFYPIRKKSQDKKQEKSGRKNQFHNFDQREYDYEALTQKCIEKVNEVKK